jgi:hypothetical protein
MWCLQNGTVQPGRCLLLDQCFVGINCEPVGVWYGLQAGNRECIIHNMEQHPQKSSSCVIQAIIGYMIGTLKVIKRSFCFR